VQLEKQWGERAGGSNLDFCGWVPLVHWHAGAALEVDARKLVEGKPGALGVGGWGLGAGELGSWGLGVGFWVLVLRSYDGPRINVQHEDVVYLRLHVRHGLVAEGNGTGNECSVVGFQAALEGGKARNSVNGLRFRVWGLELGV